MQRPIRWFDFVVAVSAPILASLFRLGSFEGVLAHARPSLFAIAVLILSNLLVITSSVLRKPYWRYASLLSLSKIVGILMVSFLLSGLIVWAFFEAGVLDAFPLSILSLNLLVSLLLLIPPRLMVKKWLLDYSIG